MLKPNVYQDVAGARNDIAAAYVKTGSKQVGFKIGPHDQSYPLVIDPILVYSTYLGGTGNDEGRAIAVDSGGNVYVTGWTFSFNYPITINSFDTTYSNSSDVFVTKLNSTGTALVYSTYLGGAQDDNGYGIAVDSAGNAYVTGSTSSTDYPTTPGAFQTAIHGGFSPGDVFVTKLNPAGAALVYSTYIGGTSSDQAYSIAIDASGNAYIAGYTQSSNFPTTPGAFQTTIGTGGGFPSRDAFVTKLNDAGTALVYSTYLGGSASDQATGIQVDSAGNAYVTGSTLSSDFDVTPGAYQTTYGGSANFGGVGDAFVSKFNSTGAALVYSTYIGGRDDDGGLAIALGPAGEAYITGSSRSLNFPTTPGVVRVALGGATRTSNAGATWAAINTGLTSSTIQSLAIDPSNPAAVYAGTAFDGLFKSTNSGASWSTANGGLTDLNILSLAIDPVTTSTVYLGTNSRGVFKSTDSGATWRGINTGQSGATVWAIRVDAMNPATLYAGTSSGLFKSTDSGANWSKTSLVTILNSNALVLDPRSGSVAYAGNNGVYKTTDAGATWSLTAFSVGQINNLAIDPGGTALYACTNSGIAKTTDGGNTWNGVNTGLTNRSVSALSIDPLAPATLYAGTTNGVFKSINGGGTWSPSNIGLAGASISALAVDPATPATVYAGASSAGLDAFAAKLNPAGTSLDYSTLLGGNNTDQASAIAVDAQGNAYLTGSTSSLNFPTTRGAFPFTSIFAEDAFVSKLDPNAASLLYSTYLGGFFDDDKGAGIAVNSAGEAFVAGTTFSRDFPVTAGAFQTVLGSISSGFGSDAFVTKFPASPGFTSDLRVSMNVAGSPGTAGSSFSYNITVTNDGPDKAYSIRVTDDLPSSVVFGNCFSSSVSCQSSGNMVVFTIPSLDAGASTNITVGASVGCSIPNGVMINNTVNVDSSGSDPNLANNTASASTSATNPVTMISPNGIGVPAAGTSNSIVNVTRGASCGWTASSNVTWITINFSSNFGNGVVNYNVAANNGTARHGTMTIAGLPFTVDQLGVCVAGIAPQSAPFPGSGGPGMVTVTAPGGCAWTAFSNDSWITVTSGSSGTGNGSVGLSVAPNLTANPRSGMVFIAGNTFVVNQGGAIGQSDFDSDRKTEIGFYRNGLWGILKSAQGFGLPSAQFFSWGGAGLQPIIADFDGDQKADIAYIVPPAGGQSAVYAILRSSTGYSFAPGQALFVPAGFPSLGDTPVVGDFDGDGKADPGIWRSSQGIWIIPLSSTNYTSFLFMQWGQLGDTPIVADFDGDGRADIGFYRDGLWGVLKSSQSYALGSAQFFSWGGAGLQPIVGDFDGDGRADIGYVAPPAGGQSAVYSILKSGNGYSFAPGQALFVPAGFPALGDTPIVGDFDGDGKTDPAVWRSSVGVWIIPLSSTNYSSFIFAQWGQPGDIPVPNRISQR